MVVKVLARERAIEVRVDKVVGEQLPPVVLRQLRAELDCDGVLCAYRDDSTLVIGASSALHARAERIVRWLRAAGYEPVVNEA